MPTKKNRHTLIDKLISKMLFSDKREFKMYIDSSKRQIRKFMLNFLMNIFSNIRRRKLKKLAFNNEYILFEDFNKIDI